MYVAALKLLNIYFFADDLKIYAQMKTLQDCVCLQNDINSVYNWVILNGMLLNFNKTKSVSFSRKTTIINLYIYLFKPKYSLAREAKVRIHNSLYKPYYLQNGIPKGATLGSLLFIIFINDINVAALKLLSIYFLQTT